MAGLKGETSMNERMKGRSPALIVAVLALVAAVAGTAVAEEATTSAKPVTKTKAKKIAKKEVDKKFPIGVGDIDAGVLQPRAFGQVNNNGTVIAANSEGITSPNVTMSDGNTLYCFRGLPFTPKVLLANVVWTSSANIDVRTATIPPDIPSSCPADTQASARTTDSATGSAALAARIQFALFD